MKKRNIISCEIAGDKITVADISISGKKVRVIDSREDRIADGESPVEKILAMAGDMGIKGGRIFISDSSLSKDNNIYTVPPMSRGAEKRYLLTKIAANTGINPDNLMFAYPEDADKKRKVPRHLILISAERSLVNRYMGLEDKGFKIGCLTTPEMAVWSLASYAGLLTGKERFLVYISGTTAYIVAGGHGGPFFARSFKVVSGEGFAFTLHEELRHANIFLQQRYRKNISSLILIGVNVADDIKIAGIDISSFSGEGMLNEPSSDVVTFSLPLVSSFGKPVNLLKGLASHRAVSRYVKIASLFVGIIALFFMFRAGLELDTERLRLTSRLAELERLVQEIKDAPVPQEDYRAVENRAIENLLQQTNLKMPDWSGFLKEITLIIPNGMYLDSMEITRRDEKNDPSASKGKSRGVKAGDKDERKGWVMTIKGGLSGNDYQEMQELLKNWHREMSISPYLKGIKMESINMSGGNSKGRDDESERMSELKFTLIANVIDSYEMENVIKKVVEKGKEDVTKIDKG